MLRAYRHTRDQRRCTPEEGLETLQFVGELMYQVEGQLDRLMAFGLEKEDRAALEQIKTVTLLLRMQAKSLSAYWTTGEAAEAKQYHEVRKGSWKGLAKILQVAPASN